MFPCIRLFAHLSEPASLYLRSYDCVSLRLHLPPLSGVREGKCLRLVSVPASFQQLRIYETTCLCVCACYSAFEYASLCMHLCIYESASPCLRLGLPI